MNRIVGALALLAFAGCSSYSEIAKWDSSVKANDGEVPIASFMTRNHSYLLLHFIPLCSGVPWTEGNGPVKDNYSVRPFSDLATVDNNLKSLKHALDVVGSHRITQLRTMEDSASLWSFFVIRRREVRTECLILPPSPKE